MKNLFALILLVFPLFVFSQMDIFTRRHAFSSGQEVYLFGDQVKLRTGASTSSEVVDLLGIGSAVTILEKTNETLFFNGFESPWYKVRFGVKEGYVLGALMALQKIEYDGETFLFNQKQLENSLEIDVRRIDGASYVEYKGVISEDAVYQFSVTEGRGLSELEYVVTIDMLSESCGVDGGEVLFLIDQKDQYTDVFLTDISDAGIFSFEEQLIFPNEEGGVEGQVLYRSEKYEALDAEMIWGRTTIIDGVYEFHDGKLFPELSKILGANAY